MGQRDPSELLLIRGQANGGCNEVGVSPERTVRNTCVSRPDYLVPRAVRALYSEVNAFLVERSPR
jgi:hypothetical protein